MPLESVTSIDKDYRECLEVDHSVFAALNPSRALRHTEPVMVFGGTMEFAARFAMAAYEQRAV